ncbi:MAG: ComF family protein [Verrucomicrobiales bacterium]
MVLPAPPSDVFRRGGFSRLLDLIYPPSCALCSEALRDGRSLCSPCREGLPRLADPFCRVCGEGFDGQIDGAFECPNCRDLSFAFEFARPALFYDERTMGLIHRLKYSREVHLARELGSLAAEAFEDPRLAEAMSGNWPLVPVPLHHSRFQHRHFNQSAEIARVLAMATGLPLLKALKRTRRTETQTRLSRAQRLANLRGAFAMSGSGLKFSAAKPAGAVLVDDVFTTGSTVHECARVLRRAGVQKVIVVTVMRG